MGCGPRCFEEIGKPKKQCVLDGDQSYGEGGYKWGENSKYKNNLDINIYTDRGTEIPHKARPNDDTLLFYAFDYIDDYKNNKKFLISPSINPYKFESDLIEDKRCKKRNYKEKISIIKLFII